MLSLNRTNYCWPYIFGSHDLKTFHLLNIYQHATFTEATAVLLQIILKLKKVLKVLKYIKKKLGLYVSYSYESIEDKIFCFSVCVPNRTRADEKLKQKSWISSVFLHKE